MAKSVVVKMMLHPATGYNTLVLGNEPIRERSASTDGRSNAKRRNEVNTQHPQMAVPTQSVGTRFKNAKNQ